MISTSCENEFGKGMGIPCASFTGFTRSEKKNSIDFYRNTYPTCTKEQQAQNKAVPCSRKRF